MKRITAYLILLISGFGVNAQDQELNKYVLTLDDVIDLAISQSSAIKYPQNHNVNYFWRYRNFKTRFRPQLKLTGNLPNYRNTTSPITQPDGSIEFKKVSNLNVSSVLSLNQSIPQLGTYI